MVENVSNVLISEGVINRDGCEPIKAGCGIGNGPLRPVFGENAKHFHLLPFWLVKQMLSYYSASHVLGPLSKLLVADV
jgi:hypothetical protein